MTRGSVLLVDDEPKILKALHDALPAERSHLRLFAPGDVGAKAIGHFGMFRPMFAETLWAHARDFLDDQAGRAIAA